MRVDNIARPASSICTTLTALTLAAAVLLAGCAPVPTPAPIATPRILQVQMTPSLQSLAVGFSMCAEEQPATGLVTLETPADALDPALSLALRWGPPNELPGSVSVIGYETLVVIVHPQDPRAAVALEELRGLYQGKQSGTAWAYPAGDDVQQVFEAAVLDGEPAPARAVSLAPHPQAMREAVAGEPGAVGFLPQRWLDDTVKAVTVEGIAPERLTAPILAMRNTEPSDPEKAWLLCLQAALQVYNAPSGILPGSRALLRAKGGYA
jgi:hypothetical protein